MSERFNSEASATTTVEDEAPIDVVIATVAPPEVAPPPLWPDEPDDYPGTDRADADLDEVEPSGTGGAAIPDRSSPPASRLRRFVRGRDDDPTWVRPALLVLLVATGVLYIWGLGASGMGQQLLLGGGAGRHQELEGLLLRLLRRLELHHRRQASGLPVGDGALGPHLRRERRGASSCPRPSREWPRSGSSTPVSGGGSPRAPP